LLLPGRLLPGPQGELPLQRGLRLHVPGRLLPQRGLRPLLQEGLPLQGGLLLPLQGAPLPPGEGPQSSSLLLAVAMAAVL
jgi:hypothetical protein